MTWVAVAIAGASVVGGLISADSSRSAANKQSDAAQAGIDTQWQMFNQNKQDLAPWMQSGQTANNALLQLLGLGGPAGTFDPNASLVRPFGMTDFQQDPSYQWRLQQGNQAVMANRAARGGIQSGQTLKDLTNYSQGLASTEYQNAFNRYQQQQGNVFNRLAGLSNTGVNAAGNIAGFGANAAGNVTGLQYAQGQAQAGGALGYGSAINQGIGGLTLAGILGQNQSGGNAGWGSYIPGTTQNALYNSTMNDFNQQAFFDPYYGGY